MHALLLLLAASVPTDDGLKKLPEPPKYEWKAFKDGDTSQVALLKDGKQVGAYHFAGRLYRTYDAKTGAWGEVSAPPISPPLTAAKKEPTAYYSDTFPYTLPQAGGCATGSCGSATNAGRVGVFGRRR